MEYGIPSAHVGSSAGGEHRMGQRRIRFAEVQAKGSGNRGATDRLAAMVHCGNHDEESGVSEVQEIDGSDGAAGFRTVWLIARNR